MQTVAPLRILVTRPQPQADEWVQALREHELDAHALPLIAIEAPAGTREYEIISVKYLG